MCGFRGIVAVALFLLTIVSTAQAKYSGGSGTAQDPYQIATAADLIALGETPADYDKHFLLTADIDLDPRLPGRKVFDRAVIARWEPFTGVFDGNAHTIWHLTIRGTSDVGLFGQLGGWVHERKGEVKDLGLADVDITSSGGYGDYVGAVAAGNFGFVTRCYSTGVVRGVGISSSYVGGLVGRNGGDVTNSYSTSTVSGAYWVGGLVGGNDKDVTQCYAAGLISYQWEDASGLVGYNGGTVSHSIWDMEVSSLSASPGGVGLTTVEMMDPRMLALNGFANDPDWILDAGHDYPRLAWQGTPGQIIPECAVDCLEGNGTVEVPYRIDTVDQLIFLGRASALCDRHFVLDADIDLDPNLPDRRVFRQALVPAFAGVFDGNHHTISHLTIIGGDNLGLFGQLSSMAVVKNLGVIHVKIAGSGHRAGVLVANNAGDIVCCYASGSLKSAWDAGGLAQSNSGTVTQCHSTVAVSGVSCVAGLVAYNYGAVTDCYSNGDVSGSGAGAVGGLVGRNTGGAVTQCCSSGTVSGTGGDDVGGLVGDNGGTVTDCYSTGAVSGNSFVGGLVGQNSADVTHCYSTGAVSSTGWGVGGLVGSNPTDESGETLGRATVCFWDTQTSGQATSAGGTGKTTAEMQTAKTFLDAGWDFVAETANGTADLWWILEGKDYPRLWWEAAKK
jgi:hypothetical protein